MVPEPAELEKMVEDIRYEFESMLRAKRLDAAPPQDMADADTWLFSEAGWAHVRCLMEFLLPPRIPKDAPAPKGTDTRVVASWYAKAWHWQRRHDMAENFQTVTGWSIGQARFQINSRIMHISTRRGEGDQMAFQDAATAMERIYRAFVRHVDSPWKSAFSIDD